MGHRNNGKMRISEEESVEMKKTSSIEHSNIKLNVITEINKINISINKIESNIEEIKDLLLKNQIKQNDKQLQGYDNINYS